MLKHSFVIVVVNLLMCYCLVASDPETKTYSEVVVQDKPVAYYANLENEPADGSEIRNSANAGRLAPSGFVRQSVKRIDGPAGVGRAFAFNGMGYVELPHDAVFNKLGENTLYVDGIVHARTRDQFNRQPKAYARVTQVAT